MLFQHTVYIIIVQIHLSWIVNLEYTCLDFYMEKLFTCSLKAFSQISSPVHYKCSLALMLQWGYWDLGTLCMCPFSNPLTHNVMPYGGQIEVPAILIEAWLHRMNKNCFLHPSLKPSLFQPQYPGSRQTNWVAGFFLVNVAGNLRVDWAGSLMLVKSSFKGSFRLPYVVLPTVFTGHMIDWAHHSFLGNRVF